MNENNYRILVIDDEDRVRQAVRRVLEPQGYELEEALNGKEGLAKIESHRPDLVLVDLMMPVMDGMEFIEQARREHPAMVFVVITGYATLEKAVESMKQGADDFLAKPFKPQELRVVVERALKRVRTLHDMAVEKGRTRVLVESMTNGVLVTDTSGRVVMLNTALRGWLGLNGDEVMGGAVAELLPCNQVVQALEGILSGEFNNAGEQTCQVTLGSAEQPRHLQVHCQPFVGPRGRVLGAVAVFDDVTALRELDELKSEYVSTVAHEVASPLSSVVSQLQTLAKGMAGPLTDKQAQMVDRAMDRIQGIITLSKELLDLAKIEARSLGEPEPVELGPLLGEAVELLRAKAEDKGLELSLELDDSTPKVMGVPMELSEVFVNLISNAVRYTPEGGQVRVSAAGEDGWAVVRVADTGYGIAPEEQANIFQRFYRVKDANTRHIVGTGLGLCIVKRVVDSVGGRIELDSAPGQGSTFVVRLPGEGGQA